MRVDKDLRLFALLVVLIMIMLFCLGFLVKKVVDLDSDLQKSEQQKEYYLNQLVKGNKAITQADSINQANGIFNPEDTTWEGR